MILPTLGVFTIAAISAELLVPSSPAAFAVPVFMVAEGVVVWWSFRLFARLDPSGLLIKNFANTHELRWNEIHEITPVNDFGLSNLTVGFHLHDQSGFLARLPAAQGDQPHRRAGPEGGVARSPRPLQRQAPHPPATSDSTRTASGGCPPTPRETA
jgi:hypothetical protein